MPLLKNFYKLCVYDNNKCIVDCKCVRYVSDINTVQ